MTFVEELHEKYSAKFHEVVSHPFTTELCQGTLPDYKLYTYLVQDLKFFQDSLKVLGTTLAYCDDPVASIVIGKQVGFLAHDENTYFQTCLKQLETDSLEELREHAPSMLAKPSPTLPQVQKYLGVLRELAFNCTEYAKIITYMYVMEKSYLGWVQYNEPTMGRLEYKHQEWVDLHNGPAFCKWVDFLASEVNRVAADASARELMREAFQCAVQLEIDFFEACYKI